MWPTPGVAINSSSGCDSKLAQRAIEKGNREASIGGQNPIGKGFVEAAVIGAFDETLTKPFVSAYKSIAVVGDGFPGHW